MDVKNIERRVSVFKCFAEIHEILGISACDVFANEVVETNVPVFVIF